MTLKHDKQCVLEIKTHPEAVSLSEHRFEIKFANALPWRTLGTGTTMDWTTGVAGNFSLRGKAKLNGTWLYSSEKAAAVQFPTRSQILSDVGMVAAMDAEWQQTLIDSAPTQYRERSFMVYLDTIQNTYEADDYKQGDWVAPGNNASVWLDFKIDPEPFANAVGARYLVASFHTHTPEEFAPTNFPGRYTGPLGQDEPTAIAAQTPGFVYDYIDSPIFSGYAETNNAMIRGYGPTQKEIP